MKTSKAKRKKTHSTSEMEVDPILANSHNDTDNSIPSTEEQEDKWDGLFIVLYFLTLIFSIFAIIQNF